MTTTGALGTGAAGTGGAKEADAAGVTTAAGNDGDRVTGRCGSGDA